MSRELTAGPSYQVASVPLWHRFAPAVLSGILALLAWSPWGTPAAALLVVCAWALCESRLSAFFAATAYYLASTWLLPIMVMRFYGQSGTVGVATGTVAWIGWSAFLGLVQSLPYQAVRKRRPWGILAGLILAAVPPVGWFDVMSPLHSIGYWFPGTAWYGLAMAAVAVLVLARLVHLQEFQHYRQQPLFVGTTAWLLLAVLGFHQVEPVRGLQQDGPGLQVIAMSTTMGPPPASVEQEFARIDGLQRQVRDIQKQTLDQPVLLVFPEITIAELRPRTQYWLEDAVQATADGRITWVAGAMHRGDEDGRPVNGVLLADHGHAKWMPGRVSFPGAMWRPGGFAAPMGDPPSFNVAGKYISVAICYEDLLPWTNAQLYWHQVPDVHVSIASVWMLGRMEGHRQAAMVDGWARLFDVSTIRAVNQ